MSQEGLFVLREITRRRMAEIQFENEKVFDYDRDDYENWTLEWYEQEPEGVRCQACYGTGQDNEFDSDCMVCFGEGYVDGFDF